MPQNPLNDTNSRLYLALFASLVFLAAGSFRGLFLRKFVHCVYVLYFHHKEKDQTNHFSSSASSSSPAYITPKLFRFQDKNFHLIS